MAAFLEARLYGTPAASSDTVVHKKLLQSMYDELALGHTARKLLDEIDLVGSTSVSWRRMHC